MKANVSSRKVLEKSGFIQEGLLRNFAYLDNRYINVYYYGIIKDDYVEWWNSNLWNAGVRFKGDLKT